MVVPSSHHSVLLRIEIRVHKWNKSINQPVILAVAARIYGFAALASGIKSKNLLKHNSLFQQNFEILLFRNVNYDVFMTWSYESGSNLTVITITSCRG